MRLQKAIRNFVRILESLSILGGSGGYAKSSDKRGGHLPRTDKERKIYAQRVETLILPVPTHPLNQF